MVLNILLFITLNTCAIVAAVAVSTAVLAFARLLPMDVQIAVSRVLAEASRYIAASQYQIRNIEADPIRIDPINWYGRGNVLYQIGQILTEYDLMALRRRSDRALLRLSKLKVK